MNRKEHKSKQLEIAATAVIGLAQTAQDVREAYQSARSYLLTVPTFLLCPSEGLAA